MKKEINKCKHCHEKECQELSEIIYEGKKEMWCESCLSGKIIYEQENGNKPIS